MYWLKTKLCYSLINWNWNWSSKYLPRTPVGCGKMNIDLTYMIFHFKSTDFFFKKKKREWRRRKNCGPKKHVKPFLYNSFGSKMSGSASALGSRLEINCYRCFYWYFYWNVPFYFISRKGRKILTNPSDKIIFFICID